MDAALDALARLQEARPRFDHRFTLEHYCISTTDQARRARALGAVASVNSYFVHFRSQIHADAGLGPDRSEAIARLGTLAQAGVPFALHSDYSLTLVPMHPLTAAWAAVNRIARRSHGRDGRSGVAACGQYGLVGPHFVENSVERGVA